MKTKTILRILVIITAVVILTALCDARTRTINTSSNRGSGNPAVVTNDDEEKVTNHSRTNSYTVSGNSGNHSTSRGNIRDSGNVQIIKSSQKQPVVIEKQTEKSVGFVTKSGLTKQKDSLGTAGRVRTYKITGTSDSESTGTKNTVVSSGKRIVSTDNEIRESKRTYKVTKNTISGTDSADTRGISYRTKSDKTDPLADNHGNHEGTGRGRDDRTIGNVWHGGNVNTGHKWSNYHSEKVGNISVRRSAHFIHNGDNMGSPRRFPSRYFYWWGGNWNRFPVAKGHFPRYFYYWRDNCWNRVDRTIIYNVWVPRGYYDYGDTATAPGEVYPPAEEYQYGDFITKGETEENLISRTFTLSPDEKDRVERLLDAEIIQNILASVEPDEENRKENSYEFVPDDGLLTITAPEELVLKIQTIIQDERTFDEFYNSDNKLAVDVISVVSPVFMEKDYDQAASLGGRNAGQIQSYLESLDRRYLSSQKKSWYNESIGTVTVVDEENLYRAWEYMNKFPYIPKNLIK